MLSSNFNQLPQNPPALLPEYEVPPEKRAYYAFLQSYPGYGDTDRLDNLRRAEYGRLDRAKHIYLDYTGGGLHADSQLTRHMEMLNQGVFGNPHSANPTSQAMTQLVEEARKAVMRYFNASSREYVCVFTPNATGALKLVGEAYPFAPGGRYLLTFDNHNSVNGIREFARQQGADISYVPLTTPDLRIDRQILSEALSNKSNNQPSLFAFPAQSNFTGVKHPLTLVEEAQQKGWDVLLDAASFVPTNRLDLRQVKPDFVTLSFYKMFGYPTGVGALFIKKSTLLKLNRPWFAGGTVNFATVQGDGHHLAEDEAAFEDGTINYLSIPAVKIGLEHMRQVGLDEISERIRCLTGWLIEQLLAMRHSNDKPMVRIYGPTSTVMRGGTLTLNFYDPDGLLIDYRRIEELANGYNISLRTGCFCNPGAGEIAEGLTSEDMLAGLDAEGEMNLMRFMQIIEGRGQKSAGAIRVSMGIVTNFHDIYEFIEFAKAFKDQTKLSLGSASFDIEGCRVIREKN
ncbi:MAG: aminotransferase class V-fold PLP-dependent enzyme [Chloroflexota bacterium]